MARSRGLWIARTGVKLLVAVLVIGFVARHVVRTWSDLASHGRSLRLDPAWMLLAALLYLAGLSLCGLFYGRILRQVPPGVGHAASVRAYLISHLGKYVPGKAMVVVMRVGLTTRFGIRAATATCATFYETLVMMASGGLIAAIGFSASKPLSVPLPFDPSRTIAVPPSWIGLATAIGFLAIISPPVFPRLASLARKPFRGLGPDVLPRITWRLLLEGLAWTILAWILMGLSQVAVLHALLPGGVSRALWPAVVASVALATVAGFVVAVAPGGLGIRETVLWTALGTAIDADLAVVAALALRLAWVAAEVVAGGSLAVLRPRLPEIGAGS